MIFKELLIEFRWSQVKKKINKVKLVVFDLDGVFTDGYIYLNKNGEQTKRFNVKDGLGIKLLQKSNFKIAVITGGKGEVAKQRIEDLGIFYFFYKVKDKKDCLNKLQKKLKISKQETLYLGDDLNDLPVKSLVSLLVGTNDANLEFKKRCDLILKNEGGRNAVRELSERLIKNNASYRFIKKNGFIETN